MTCWHSCYPRPRSKRGHLAPSISDGGRPPMAEARATSQLGRSALLVHGMAWLAAGLGAGMVRWMPTSNDAAKALGVPLAATFVLFIWSMMLAIRAVRADEKTSWPLTVIGLGLFEIVAGFGLILTL